MNLSRQDIANFIRDRSRTFARYTNSPSVLMENFYQCLKLSVKGVRPAFVGLANNSLALADLVGVSIAEEAVRVNETKGKDYAPGVDILENFYRVADVCGVSPLTVWGVYVTKHVEAIRTFILHGKLESEPIEGRLVDTLVYSALGYFIAEREASEGGRP